MGLPRRAGAYVPLIPHVAEVDNTFVQPWVLAFNPNDFTSYFKYLDVDAAGQRRGRERRNVAPR